MDSVALPDEVATESVAPTARLDEPAPSVATTRPWVASESIWFFYHSVTLAASETNKIATIARYIVKHPNAIVGINRPADASGVEPDSHDLNQQRVSAIRAALVQAGIPAPQIHVGAFGNQPASLDRQVVVFVRTTL